MSFQRPNALQVMGLDELDVAVLGELQRDGRAPLTGLGSRLGVSHGTVRNRLERLIAHQIVQITAVVDPAKVGLPTQVLIGINADLEHLETIEERLEQFQEITFVATLTGRLDFVVGAAFESNRDLREFLVNKLSKVIGIRSTETFHVLSLGKRVWQWRVPREGGRLAKASTNRGVKKHEKRARLRTGA